VIDTFNQVVIQRERLNRPIEFYRQLIVNDTVHVYGSLVRTSVFNWQTFPGLRLICGWNVTTSWVRCPLWINQPGQLSLPSLPGRKTSSNPCNYMDWITGVETIKRQTGTVCVVV